MMLPHAPTSKQVDENDIICSLSPTPGNSVSLRQIGAVLQSGPIIDLQQKSVKERDNACLFLHVFNSFPLE
jgi:hypothetical protein